MSRCIVIIDAYNVIYRVPALREHLRKSVDTAREVLIRYCLEWKERRSDVSLFQIVFDGNPSLSGTGNVFRARNVQILYPEPGQLADHKIMSILRNSSENTRYIVVSDDNEVRDVARAHGAELMCVTDFYGVLSKTGRSRSAKDAGTNDKNLTPDQIKRINDDLLEKWGGNS